MKLISFSIIVFFTIMCHLAPGIEGRRGINILLANREYLFSNGDKKTWGEARDYCRTIGMNMVSIETERENNLIVDYIQNEGLNGGYWLGGSGNTWVDTGRRMKYTNYAEKTSYGEIKWRHMPASTLSNYICEERD